MGGGAREYLDTMGRQDKQFAALYRQAAAAFGISECAMWVLYFIRIAETPLTQHELIELMMFPKQTINSAVFSLVKRGYLRLEPIPGTHNRKHVQLTPAGEAFARSTVERLIRAEEQAVTAMGLQRAERYVALRNEFLDALHSEFEREEVLDHGA
ncbi:DNA-binding transcriptional regulator, MarR family [Actinomyces ruminicola]|uniref:DNA-binding transcriptional regulator, MarR family n=1 Tax=Actinomyces ruminicola TaxID=332524 RepID=A0A1G9ZYH9_9ACTO|nr:MarR family transcriptional regulator [Actinomyces ruminicola]SDN26652.1 DNA-binding transcriptional regulator, MarR family [Actinomyces ruminicola]